jgi:hypothetical protein
MAASPETVLGVAVHFPASRGSYPLLSSDQSGPSRELELTISGFARATAAPAYEVMTEHCVGTIQATDEMRQWMRIGPSDRNQRFTRFHLSAKSARAGKDLRRESSYADFVFEPGAAVAVTRAADWLEVPHRVRWEFGAALLVFWSLSLASYFLARALWVKSSRPPVSRCARMAVANVLTLLWPLLDDRRRAEEDRSSPRAAVAFILISSAVLVSLVSLLRWLIAPS